MNNPVVIDFKDLQFLLAIAESWAGEHGFVESLRPQALRAYELVQEYREQQ